MTGGAGGRDRLGERVPAGHPLTVRPAGPADAPTIAAVHARSWGGAIARVHGVTYDLTTLPTLVCVDGAGEIAGVVTMDLDGDSLEVVSIDARTPGQGAGTALMREAMRRALRRLWSVTTNDNLDALRFYQRLGLRITAVAAGAVDRARELKPAIPLVGGYGIELHDELTLEWVAPADRDASA